MAYVEPKVNWEAGNIPVASDLNRIESNAKANHDAIDAEEAARIADVNAEEAARIAADNAEEAARIAADNAIIAALGGVDFVNGNAGTYGSVTVPARTSALISKGLYMMTSEGPETFLQIKTGSSFVGEAQIVGLVLSDGVNFYITNRSSSVPFVVYYRKLA